MKNKIKGIGPSIFLFIWSALIILPLLWIIFVSLKTNNEFFMNPWALPDKLQFGNYVKAMSKMKIGPAFLNTIYYVVGQP